MANIVTNEDQLKVLKERASDLSQSYKDDEMYMQSSAIDMFVENKNTAYDEFKKDYSLASSILSDPDFIDEELEWTELSSKINNMTDENGNKKYENGLFEWLTEEHARVNSIASNIKTRKAGNNRNFKYF